MAANTAPIFVAVPRHESVKIATSSLDPDGAGSATLFSAGADGARVHAISVALTGQLNSDLVLRLFIEKAGTFSILGEHIISTHTPVANVSAPVYSLLEYSVLPFIESVERFITLGPGESLYIAALGTPTNPIHVTAMGGDY